jgi:hypothetical protein
MSERSPKSSSKRRPSKGELTSSEKNGYDSVQAEAEARTKAYHKKGLNTDWKSLSYRVEPNHQYLPVRTELISDEILVAENETLVAENKRIKETLKRWSDEKDKRAKEREDITLNTNKLKENITKLENYIAKYCPKKKFKTVGGQKQKNKTKKPKSNKTKKRKYKRSKHRHTKKPN